MNLSNRVVRRKLRNFAEDSSNARYARSFVFSRLNRLATGLVPAAACPPRFPPYLRAPGAVRPVPPSLGGQSASVPHSGGQRVWRGRSRLQGGAASRKEEEERPGPAPARPVSPAGGGAGPDGGGPASHSPPGGTPRPGGQGRDRGRAGGRAGDALLGGEVSAPTAPELAPEPRQAGVVHRRGHRASCLRLPFLLHRGRKEASSSLQCPVSHRGSGGMAMHRWGPGTAWRGRCVSQGRLAPFVLLPTSSNTHPPLRVVALPFLHPCLPEAALAPRPAARRAGGRRQHGGREADGHGIHAAPGGGERPRRPAFRPARPAGGARPPASRGRARPKGGGTRKGGVANAAGREARRGGVRSG